MYCLDTDTVVDFLRGNEKVTAKFEQNIGSLFITEITVFELYYGAYISANTEQSIISLKGFLKHMQILGFNDDVFDLFGKNKSDLKKEGKILDNFDLIIALYGSSPQQNFSDEQH